MLLTLWWVWGAAALVLGILEILIPGYLFLGFAVGAFLVAMFLLNTGLSVSVPVVLLIFALMSLVAWLVMRRIFALPKGQVQRFTDDVND